MPLTYPLQTTSLTNRSVPIRQAQPILRITKPNNSRYLYLNKGKAGSLQTAAQMAELVREDTIRDLGLQSWAAKILITNGLDSHSAKRDVVDAVFNYVQRFKYIYDPAGAFESIQDARTTIKRGFGDCDDLSILLATLLAQVGLRPRFVLARYKQATKGYDHIYVDVELPPDQGGRVALDPSSRNASGWERYEAIERITYPIFSGSVTKLAGAGSLATTGATIGLNFVPVVGPILSSLVGPISSLFSRTQQRTEEATRDQYRDQVYTGFDQIKSAVANCRVSATDGTAAARQLVDQMYSACDQFTKKSVAASCRNFETQDVPGGAQEGAFKTRLAQIASAGANCATNGVGKGELSSSANGEVAGSSGAGSTLSLPLLIAVGAGLYFLTR